MTPPFMAVDYEAEAKLRDAILGAFGVPARLLESEETRRRKRSPSFQLCLDIATDIEARLAWSELPVLADALEEAGCPDQVMLDHLRDSGHQHGHPNYCLGTRTLTGHDRMSNLFGTWVEANL